MEDHGCLGALDDWLAGRRWAYAGAGSLLWTYPAELCFRGLGERVVRLGLWPPQVDLITHRFGDRDDEPWRMTVSGGGAAYGGCERHRVRRDSLALDPEHLGDTLVAAEPLLDAVESRAADLDADELLLCAWLGDCPPLDPGPP